MDEEMVCLDWILLSELLTTGSCFFLKFIVLYDYVRKRSVPSRFLLNRYDQLYLSKTWEKLSVTLQFNRFVYCGGYSFAKAGFVFIFIGIAQLISNYQANSVQITLKRQGNIFTNNQQTYVSFNEGDNVAIYLQIQNLTQYTYKQTHKYQEIDKYIQSS